MTPASLQVWFQNKRSKERRMKALAGRGGGFFMGGKRMRGFGLGTGLEDARFGFYEGIGPGEFNYPGGNFYPGGPGGPPGLNFSPAGETISVLIFDKLSSQSQSYSIYNRIAQFWGEAEK